jgi:hypothetical protein
MLKFKNRCAILGDRQPSANFYLDLGTQSFKEEAVKILSMGGKRSTTRTQTYNFIDSLGITKINDDSTL